MVPSEIGILLEYRGVTGTPPGVNGPIWALREKRRGGQGRPRAPSPLVRIGQGRGGAPPFFLSPSLLPSPTRQGRGVLLPVGVGLLLAHPLGSGRSLPSPPLYTGAGGTLEHTS